MREDTFTNTVADAGRYDYATFPQPGSQPRAAQAPLDRPEWDCGHLPVKIDGKWADRCAGGRDCPNGGWTR